MPAALASQAQARAQGVSDPFLEPTMHPESTTKTPTIIDPENEVGIEVLAKSIVDLSEAAQKLLSGSLKMRTLLVLLHDSTGIPMAHIKRVLEGAAELRKEYVK